MGLGTKTRRSRGNLLIWLLLGAALLYIGTRVAATLLSASRLERRTGLSGTDIFVVSVLLGLFLIAVLLRWIVRRSRLAAESLRKRFPDAVVVPSVLRAEDRSVMERVASPVLGVFKPPQYATVVLTAESVSWWTRGRPMLVAQASVLADSYRAGSIAHGLGTFPALIAKCQTGAGEIDLPILLMQEATVFPRHVDAQGMEAIRTRLGSAAAAAGSSEPPPPGAA